MTIEADDEAAAGVAFKRASPAPVDLGLTADSSRAPSGRPDAGSIPFLDSLRFLAAVMVMLNHLRVNQFLGFAEVEVDSTVLKACFFIVTRLGLEAVIVFFVLSGFLVGGMSVERAIGCKFDTQKYFI